MKDKMLSEVAERAVWIHAHYPTPESALGQCAVACHAMKAAFPSLRLTNGEVSLFEYAGTRLHWWLVDEDGGIVDPTAHQFMACPIAAYHEMDDTHPARHYPRCKCMNCGEVFYDDPDHRQFSPLCSQDCATAYVAYCNNPF